MWNSLNNSIRNVDTLSKFKSELKKIDESENHPVPKHYFYGPRKLNIILTQLRRTASFLNTNRRKNKIKMDSNDVHVHPIQFQLYQLYDKESF
jgi:hypothetical protein